MRKILYIINKFIDLNFIRSFYFRLIFLNLYIKFIFKKKNIVSKIILQSFPYSMAGEKALKNCIENIKYIEKKNIPGDICEFGVAKGGTSLAMILAYKLFKDKIKRKFYLFDSFAGLPKPDKIYDFDKSGSIGTVLTPIKEGDLFSNFENVKKLFYKKFNLSKKEVFFIKGFFEITAKKNLKYINNISILRLDGDWFSSVYIPLKYYYPKVKKKGVIIIDDYNTCVGAKRALNKFLKENKIKIKMNFYGKGGMFFLK